MKGGTQEAREERARVKTAEWMRSSSDEDDDRNEKAPLRSRVELTTAAATQEPEPEHPVEESAVPDPLAPCPQGASESRQMSAPQEGIPETATGKATKATDDELLAGGTAEPQHRDDSSPPRGAVAPRSGAAAASGSAGQASILGTAGCTLHVRHIGAGGCKSEALLRKVFAPHGELIGAQIRDRKDAQGSDTSWALVTLGTAAAAQSALRATVMAPDGSTQLLVTEYSHDQAAASTGGMKAVLTEAQEVFAELAAAASMRPMVQVSAEGTSGKRIGAGDTLGSLGLASMASVHFLRDKCTMFVGGVDGHALRRVDMQTRTVTEPAPEHVDGGVAVMDFNSDETRACTNGLNGVLRCYDTSDMSAWVQLWECPHDSMYHGVAMSNDGKLVFNGNMGGSLTVHDAETGTVVKELDLRICPDLVEHGGFASACIALSAERLAGAGGLNTPHANCVKIWSLVNICDDDLNAPLELLIQGGAGPIALSPDGKLLAVGKSDGGEIRVYTIDDSKPPSEWYSVCFEASSDAPCHHCTQVEFSHSGNLLAAVWGDGITRVYDAETSARVAHFGGDGQPGSWVGCVLAFSSDDSLLVSGGLMEPVVIYQLAAIQPTYRYAIAKSIAEEPLTFAAMNSEHVALVRGKLVVVQMRATGEELCRIEAEGTVMSNSSCGPVSVSLSHVAFVVPSKNHVAVHALPSARQVCDHREVHYIPIEICVQVCISPDGSLLAVTDITRRLQIFKVDTGEAIECCNANETAISPCNTASFRPSGKFVAVTTFVPGPQALYVVDIQSDSLVIELGPAHEDAGWCLYPHFDGDESRLCFYSEYSGSTEIVCVSFEGDKRGKELLRVPAIDSGATRGFAPGTDSSLVLCAPFKQDRAVWAGSRLSVFDIDTQQETDWSPLLPLAFGADYIPFSSVGWATSSSDGSSASPARIIHAAVGSELILMDIDWVKTAVEDGAVTASQLLALLSISPQHSAKLVKRFPHVINIRDSGTGDTVLHLCARDGNLDGLRCLLSPDTGAMYTPINNADNVTALQVAIKYQFKDCAAVLWQHLSSSLNEITARYATGTLALLASKRTTSMLVLPFLRESADSITRELVSFRATLHEPIACVLPSAALSESQLAVNDENEKDQTIQTIELWREHNLLPKPNPDDVTPVTSQVVLLPGLCDDPHNLKLDQRAFHLIVENCDASVFANQVIKLTVDFKWTHNVRKIVLVHLAGYGLSLIVATVGMVASTQSSWNIACPSCWIPSAGVDALQIAVIVCEVAALLNEAMQMYRQKAQYMQDGGGWNLVDVFTSVCLMTAAISHFSGEPETVRTFGSIGVAFKWFGCETAVPCIYICFCV
jgi:WD40 repeat protein